MIRRNTTLSGLALALALPLAACEPGITDPSASADGETTVLLSAAAVGSSASLEPSLGPSLSMALLSAAGAGPISLSQVKSIDVKVTRVQVLRADTAARTDSVITLNVTGGSKINLLALPTSAANGLQLAKGTLPAGTYSNLRLVLDSATITLKQDVTAGGGPKATTYTKDTAHPLSIGGGQQATLRIPTGTFTVAADAGATINVGFSGEESVKKVIVTPKSIKMVPVLSAKGEGRGKGRDR